LIIILLTFYQSIKFFITYPLIKFSLKVLTILSNKMKSVPNDFDK